MNQGGWGLYKEEEGELGNSRYVVKVPERPRGVLVLGLRGWSPEAPKGLHRALDPLGNVIVKQGFHWASTDYGSRGYCVKRAVRAAVDLAEYCAERYRVGTTVAMGLSMGGQVAALCAIERPDLFQAFVSVYGVLDLKWEVRYVVSRLPLLALRRGPPLGAALRFLGDLRREFGGLPHILILGDDYSRYSPIERVGELESRAMLVHGTCDPVVPAEVSLRFARRMEAEGKGDLLHSLLLVECGGHDPSTVTRALPEILGFIASPSP